VPIAPSAKCRLKKNGAKAGHVRKRKKTLQSSRGVPFRSRKEKRRSHCEKRVKKAAGSKSLERIKDIRHQQRNRKGMQVKSAHSDKSCLFKALKRSMPIQMWLQQLERDFPGIPQSKCTAIRTGSFSRGKKKKISNCCVESRSEVLEYGDAGLAEVIVPLRTIWLRCNVVLLGVDCRDSASNEESIEKSRRGISLQQQKRTCISPMYGLETPTT